MGVIREFHRKKVTAQACWVIQAGLESGNLRPLTSQLLLPLTLIDNLEVHSPFSVFHEAYLISAFQPYHARGLWQVI